MLYLAADHGGYELKEHLKSFLTKGGVEYKDMGAHKLDPNDDYPDFAVPAVLEVAKNDGGNRAILICRSGVGEVIVANKFKGIRATLSWSVEHAAKSRSHNNTNVLALPGDYISKKEAEEIVTEWLTAKFSKEERHVRRLGKISDIE